MSIKIKIIETNLTRYYEVSNGERTYKFNAMDFDFFPEATVHNLNRFCKAETTTEELATLIREAEDEAKISKS